MPVRRKLLFYTHAMSGGGAERVWALLASGFAQAGHDVLLVVDYDDADNAGYVDPLVRRVTLGGNHMVASLRLARLLRAEKPDISVSALCVSNLKHLVAALLAGRRRRAIQTYHGYDHSEPQLLSQVSYWLTAVSTRLFARTLAVSDGLLAHIVGKWRAAPRNCLRIYNPVASGPAATASVTPLTERAPLVLAAGRMVAYKNFPLLIRAFARVKHKAARLIVMGEGPERPMIEAEIARLGLADRVTLAGYVPQPWALYDEARCFVLASNSESFGLVLVEALAHGLPVVATASDGPREILAGAADLGALVPHKDEAALAAAITHALAEPGDPAPRVKRAHMFSVAVAIERYAALIEDVIAKA